MKECPHCLIQIEKHAVYANHVRWCKLNPKFSVTLESTKTKLTETADKKRGLSKVFGVTCAKCNVNFKVEELEKEFPRKIKYHCSRACANSHTVSDEHKAKTSAALKQPAKYCKDCKTVEVTRSVRCMGCHKTVNREKRKARSAFRNYRYDCAFEFALKSFPDKFDFTLIEEHGWYSPSNSKNPNLNGVLRDHMVSVRYGFDNGIPAELIRHPANCQLLRHNDNISKNAKCHLSLDELLGRIKGWKLMKIES